MSRMFDLMRDRLSRLSRRTRWTLAIFASAIVVAVLLSFFIDEPLRRSVEGQMNARLTGYSVSIGKLRFHPIGLSLTLSDLVFTQQANPEPPVGRIPRLDASVHWRALLSWKLVANFALDRPKLYVNLAHLRSEAADPEPVAKHGWQEAFQAIYPLKINQFTIVNGEATYVDDGPFEPLELSAVNVAGRQYPEYPLARARLSLAGPSRRRRLQEGQGHHRRACGLPGRAPSGHQGRCRPRRDRARLLQAGHSPLQRGREQGRAVRLGTGRVRADHQGRRSRAGDDPRRAGRVHPHARPERGRAGGHRQDREGRARGEQ